MEQKKWMFIALAACMLFGSAEVSAKARHGKRVGIISYLRNGGESHYSYSSSTVKRYNDPRSNNSGLRLSQGYIADAKFPKVSDTEFPTPRYGEVVSEHHATRKAFVIQHSTGDFYFRDGVFYLHDNDKYVIHEPYLGFRVPGLPADRREYSIDGTTYYYYYGTFYTYNSASKYMEVVAPPKNAVVDWIPNGAEKVEVEGETYFIKDGVQYLSFSSGATSLYKVVMVDESLYSKGQGVTYYGFVNE